MFVLIRPGTPWLSLGWFVSSGSSVCAMAVARFVRLRLVRPGAPLVSLGSFGFVRFGRVCLRCRWVGSGSSGLSTCALRFDWFVRVCRVCVGAPKRPLFSIMFVHVGLVRPGAPWVSSLGSFECVWFFHLRPGG